MTTADAKLNVASITHPPAPPRAWLKDQESIRYYTQLKNFFEANVTWMNQVYRLLDKGNFDPAGNIDLFAVDAGGLIDAFDNVNQEFSSIEGKIEDLEQGFNSIAEIVEGDAVYQDEKQDQSYPVSTAADYTVNDSVSLVIATASITISLDPNPEDLQKVTIKRATASGYVTVDGNGNNIDGNSTFTMSRNYSGKQFIYSRDAGEWLIV